MIKKININNLFKYPIFFLTTIYIFLWPLRFFDLSIKYVLLLTLVPILLNTYNNFNNYKKDYLISSISFFILTFHFLILNNFKNLTTSSVSEIIFLTFLILFCSIYFNYLKENKKKMMIFFIIIFILSSIISLFNYRFDDPYFCGGIPDFFHVFKNHVIQSHINTLQFDSHLWLDENHIETQIFKFSNFKISFREFIFEENSHLAMIAVPIITFSIFYINLFKTYSRVLLVIFTIICFIKSSTTLIMGLAISIIFLTFINYKNLSSKKKIGIFLLITLLVSTFLFDDICRNKISPSHHGKNIINDNKAKIINEIFNTQGSLSSALTYKFFNLSFDNIKKNIIGTGIGTFKRESILYSEKNKSDIPHFDTFNLKDGTNNFNKLIVEFGIFGILLYLIVFLYSLKKNISFEEKCFLIPFIVTQSLRGAGYYNGGFSLIFIILLISYFSSFKKIK